MISQKNKLCYLTVIMSIITLSLIPTTAMASKSVYGYLEPVTLISDDVTLTAKLDTGAETASISAQGIQIYERDGKEYVKFKLSHPELEQTLSYDLPIIRHAKIKKRASEGNNARTHHSRPVVNMRISFDGQLHNIMVNLIDRSHFSTPMLLGRRALEKVGAIVDSTVKNTLLTKNDGL